LRTRSDPHLRARRRSDPVLPEWHGLLRDAGLLSDEHAALLSGSCDRKPLLSGRDGVLWDDGVLSSGPELLSGPEPVRHLFAAAVLQPDDVRVRLSRRDNAVRAGQLLSARTDLLWRHVCAAVLSGARPELPVRALPAGMPVHLDRREEPTVLLYDVTSYRG
jgi:hypothetical protein